MRLYSIIIALVCVAAATVTAFVAPSFKSVAAVDINLVNIAELGGTNLITVEFRRRNPSARFAEVHKVQFRLAGRWQPPLSLGKFGEDHLLARTNSEQVVFSVPADTDMCRFSLGYRVGQRPYCQAYFFLQRHGLSQRFPRLSRALLKRVPQQPRLRRVERDLAIPRGRHNEITSRDAATSALSHSESL